MEAVTTIETATERESVKDAARRLASAALGEGFKPDGLHKYTDQDGKPLHWRIRLKHPGNGEHQAGEKWIRPMHFDGTRYVLGEPASLRNGPKPLYQLHEIAKADPAAAIWYVEGEKCADVLARRGIVATTAGSVSSDERADFSPLARRRVILWPDNDAPGREHMDRVAAKLLALGCAIETVRTERLGLREKGDVVDYLRVHAAATEADLMGLERIPGVQEPPAVGRDAWPAPKPLPSELRPVVAFDFALLPSTLRAWIEDTAELFQCAPDYLAVAAMVSVGSLVGRRIGVRPKRKAAWTEYGNLWGLVIGRPGSMKSPAITEASRFLRRFEKAAADEYTAAMQEHEVETERFEVRRKESQRKSGGAAGIGGMLTSADAPQPPTAKRYIVNDATVEALHAICSENPQGFLSLRDEVAGLLRNLDREEFASDRAFYLESWNGNATHTLDRIGRGRNLTARLNLSMLGGTQPGRIAGYVSGAVRGSAGDDGLLQRFGLLVWPDVQGEWRDVDRYPDTDARRDAAATFECLRDLDPASIGAEADAFDGADAVPTLRLQEAAQIAFDEWHESLERELRAGEVHQALASHLSKYKKLVPSLALCLHLADGGTGAVTESAMVRALAWSEYLRTHAERLYGSATAIEVRSAKAILAKLRAGGIEYADKERRAIDARTIYRAGWAGLDREATYAGLDLLADLHCLKRETEATEGRTAILWVVNPEAIK
jgi:hypothetical protein